MKPYLPAIGWVVAYLGFVYSLVQWLTPVLYNHSSATAFDLLIALWVLVFVAPVIGGLMAAATFAKRPARVAS